MKQIYLLGLFLMCAQVLLAQVEIRFNHNFESLSELSVYKSSLVKTAPKKVVLPELDLVKKDDESKSGIPFKYAHELKINYSVQNSGTWHIVDSTAIWRLNIESKDAYSLAFGFNKFFIPEEGMVIIYSQDESFLYGPLNASNNKKSTHFTTGPIRGKSVVIEISVPVSLKEKLQLQVNRIYHGYVNIFPLSTKSANLNCHNNVACHSSWDDESDGVAKLIMGKVCAQVVS